MTLAETIKRVTGKAEWTAPPGGKRLFAEDLELLGEVRDHHGLASKVFSHRFGELVADRGTLRDGPNLALPARPYSQSDTEDGERIYQVYTWQAPGTYAGRVNAPSVTATTQPAYPIDALAPVSVLNRTETHGGRERIRGAGAIAKRLRSRSIDLRLSADRSSIVVLSPRGVTLHADAVEKAAPILLPYLRDGKPPVCQVSAHAEPVDAVTCARAVPADLPWCGECRP